MPFCSLFALHAFLDYFIFHLMVLYSFKHHIIALRVFVSLFPRREFSGMIVRYLFHSFSSIFLSQAHFFLSTTSIFNINANTEATVTTSLLSLCLSWRYINLSLDFTTVSPFDFVRPSVSRHLKIRMFIYFNRNVYLRTLFRVLFFH